MFRRTFFAATAAAVVASAAFALEKSKDIVDTAVGAGSFGTLVAAVQAADLVDTLKGDGPFTVFAPTDEAFAKLPKGTLDDLLKPENESPRRKRAGYQNGLKSKSYLGGHVVSPQTPLPRAYPTASGWGIKKIIIKKNFSQF